MSKITVGVNTGQFYWFGHSMIYFIHETTNPTSPPPFRLLAIRLILLKGILYHAIVVTSTRFDLEQVMDH